MSYWTETLKISGYSVTYNRILAVVKVHRCHNTKVSNPLPIAIVLYKVVLTFVSVDEILKFDHSEWKQLIHPSFPVLLFIMLYMVALMFECVDEILKCDHSNESYIEQYFPVVLLIYYASIGWF